MDNEPSGSQSATCTVKATLNPDTDRATSASTTLQVLNVPPTAIIYTAFVTCASNPPAPPYTYYLTGGMIDPGLGGTDGGSLGWTLIDIDAGTVVAQGTGSVFTGDVDNNDVYKCILAATDDDGAQSTAVWTFYGMQFLPITSPDEPTVTANIRDTDPNTGSWNHTAIAGEDANFDIQSTLSGEGSPPAPTMVCYYTVDGTGSRHLRLSIDIWSLGPSSSPCRSDFRHRRLPPSGTDIRRSSGTDPTQFSMKVANPFGVRLGSDTTATATILHPVLARTL